MAVRGSTDASGTFHVQEVCYPGMPDQVPRPVLEVSVLNSLSMPFHLKGLCNGARSQVYDQGECVLFNSHLFFFQERNSGDVK